MKKALLSVLVAGLLCTTPASTAFGGAEPSPWLPYIGVIQTRLILIGQSYTLSDTAKDSLDAINLRLNAELNSWVSPELAAQSAVIVDRMSTFLSNPQTDEYATQLIMTMDQITRIVFDPQPEPPGHSYIDQGFTVMDRVSRIVFDPQPEPPGLTADLLAPSIFIMSQVAGVLERTVVNGLDAGTIPALTALEKLSGHLVDAVIDKKADKAVAQVNAMSNIAEQYAGY